MMDGWKSKQYDHGLQAICKDVDGVAVACEVAIVDSGLLTAWLIAHPAELMGLWDEMDNKRESYDSTGDKSNKQRAL